MELTIEGDMSPITNALSRMEKAADRGACYKALRAGAAILAARMRDNVRKRTGMTAASIHVYEVQGNEPTIGVGATGERAKVGRLLETGYLRRNQRTGSVTHEPAYPWARPAFDASIGQVETKVYATISDDVLKAAG
jgi:hypothetical protein